MRTADLRTASDADWAEAHRREKIIRPLASLARVRGDVAMDAMEQLELGRARLHKLLQRYRASPVAASLLPRPRGREQGEQRLSAAVEQLIARGIADYYLTLEKPGVQALRRWLRHEPDAQILRYLSLRASAGRHQSYRLVLKLLRKPPLLRHRVRLSP